MPTGWGAPPPGSLPPPGTPFPGPGQGQPPPAWGGPPPPPPKSKTGLVVGLVLGGLALLLLIVIGGVVLAVNSVEEAAVPLPDPTTSRFELGPSTTRFATVPTSTGPVTSVAGTGPPASVTADQAETFLQEEQEKVLPDVPVLSVACPAEPYKVGHVIICRMTLQTTPVLYQVTITDVNGLVVKPTKPIIDTDKAEDLIEANEAGSVADCGSPRIRQVEIGATFSCRTASSTWEFTVRDEKGQISGTRR